MWVLICRQINLTVQFVPYVCISIRQTVIGAIEKNISYLCIRLARRRYVLGLSHPGLRRQSLSPMFMPNRGRILLSQLGPSSSWFICVLGGQGKCFHKAANGCMLLEISEYLYKPLSEGCLDRQRGNFLDRTSGRSSESYSPT